MKETIIGPDGKIVEEDSESEDEDEVELPAPVGQYQNPDLPAVA